ncbi:restriction endonuclease subunit S [Thiomicrospira sp.]|uniref:restriction endonuclease subunit S n=1 Tax=Thiomicrospira sp. TaxID=935 RepID=UPI002F94FF79
MSENKNVPELRFPGFEGQWLVHQLSQACNMKAGKFVQASEIHNEKESGMYPCFGGNGLRGYTRSKTHEGIYPLIGRQGALCGNVQLANGQFHATEHAVVVEASEQNDALWLYYLLDTLKLNRYATGQAQPGLSVDVIEKIKAYFPSLSEQQKIADFLSAVDKKIEQLTEKHRLLTEYKKGVMQQIFSQQIRFKDDEGNEYPEWVSIRLNKLATINPRASSLPSSFIYIDLESVEKGRLVKQEVVQLDSAPSRAQRLLTENDILFQMVRPYQKNNYFFNDEGDFVASTGYAQIQYEDAPRFLYYALHLEDFVDKVMALCTGTSYPAINSSDLGSIKINLPSNIDEQQKIAEFLTEIDNKIDQAWLKLEQTKAFKKGLLQRLFV